MSKKYQQYVHYLNKKRFMNRLPKHVSGSKRKKNNQKIEYQKQTKINKYISTTTAGIAITLVLLLNFHTSIFDIDSPMARISVVMSFCVPGKVTLTPVHMTLRHPVRSGIVARRCTPGGRSSPLLLPLLLFLFRGRRHAAGLRA